MKIDRKTIILCLIIVILLGILVTQNFASKKIVSNLSLELGKPGTEYFNQESEKKTKEKLGSIGTSIPASLAVQDGKVSISIKNTGQQAYVPYTLVNGKEVYRASRILEPGEKVSAVILVGTADKCVTYVETLNGEKFSVTTKLVH